MNSSLYIFFYVFIVRLRARVGVDGFFLLYSDFRVRRKRRKRTLVRTRFYRTHVSLDARLTRSCYFSYCVSFTVDGAYPPKIACAGAISSLFFFLSPVNGRPSDLVSAFSKITRGRGPLSNRSSNGCYEFENAVGAAPSAVIVMEVHFPKGLSQFYTMVLKRAFLKPHRQFCLKKKKKHTRTYFKCNNITNT